MNSLFLKLSLRKLQKTKVYTVINLLGLTVGFSAFILIALFLRYELSWDKSNEHYDRIYRIQRHFTNALNVVPGTEISPHSRPVTAQMIEGKYPEFEKVTVTRTTGSAFLSIDKQHLVHDADGLNADTCFFDVFSYDFIHGNKATALNLPYSIVLSESMAQKLFGTSNALNRTVLMEKKYPMTVTGVYKDLPFNSSLRPSYIISFSTLQPLQNIERSSVWTGDCMTFALLKQDVEPQVAVNKIRHSFRDYESLKYEELELCPLSKVYLNFNDRNDYLIVLRLFGLIGIFILVMSGFNYVNLSLAQASLRGKEVAIKKVTGSRKQSIMFQFLSETTAISLFSLLLSFILAKIFLPVFNDVVDKQITFSLFSDWGFALVLVAVAIATGLLSGLYPALFMASGKITALFKGNFFRAQHHGAFNLKKILVTFQFAISLFLMILTFSFSMQIRYITHKDLGFDQNGLLYTEVNVSGNKMPFSQMRDRFLKNPDIEEVSVSKNFPFVSQGGGMTNWEGCEPNEEITCRFNHISSNYLSLLKTGMVTGRNFSSDFTGDVEKSCIINETAARRFGWDNPIGKRLNDNKLTVVGVVKDFIYHDMHNPIEPSIFVLASDTIIGNWTFAFRINKEKMSSVKSFINSQLSEVIPNDAFEIKDFSSAFGNENSYKVYQSVNKSLLFFTLLNILLSIAGMFGLVSFSVARRTKEIGIRKINGSSPLGIFHLLNKEYYVLLLLAMILAFPLAWWAYDLLPSANKFPAQPWVFALGAGLMLVIILLTTCYQTVKAAVQNPVDTLKYE